TTYRSVVPQLLAHDQRGGGGLTGLDPGDGQDHAELDAAGAGIEEGGVEPQAGELELAGAELRCGAACPRLEIDLHATLAVVAFLVGEVQRRIGQRGDEPYVHGDRLASRPGRRGRAGRSHWGAGGRRLARGALPGRGRAERCAAGRGEHHERE